MTAPIDPEAAGRAMNRRMRRRRVYAVGGRWPGDHMVLVRRAMRVAGGYGVLSSDEWTRLAAWARSEAMTRGAR